MVHPSNLHGATRMLRQMSSGTRRMARGRGAYRCARRRRVSNRKGDAAAFASIVCRMPVISAHTELIKVDTLFGRGPDILNKLKQGLDAGWDGTRSMLIDCCPMLGVLSLSGIFASQRVLIPISTDYLALRGALALEKTLRALEQVLKRRVERRYLLTRFDSRRRMSHDIAGQLTSRFGAELCRTRIAEAVTIAESPALGKDIFSHAPDSRGAQDYSGLLEELLSSGFLEAS